jgi:hypothetical protein
MRLLTEAVTLLKDILGESANDPVSAQRIEDFLEVAESRARQREANRDHRRKRRDVLAQAAGSAQ